MVYIVNLSAYTNQNELIATETFRFNDYAFDSYMERLKRRTDITGFTREIVGGVNYIRIYHK